MDFTVLIVLCGLFVLILFSGGSSIVLLSLLTGSVALCIQQIIAIFLSYRYLRKTRNKNMWDALAEAAFSPKFFYWRDQDFLNAREEVRQRLRRKGKIS